MSISSILVHRCDADLNKVRPERHSLPRKRPGGGIVTIVGIGSVQQILVVDVVQRVVTGQPIQRNAAPPLRFVQLHAFYLLEIVKSGAHPDAHPLRCVGLVERVVHVKCQFAHRLSLRELDVDQMRLGPVALPVRVDGRVSYLFHPVTGFGRRQRPNGLVPDLPNCVTNYRVGQRGQRLVGGDTNDVAIGHPRSGIIGGILALLFFIFLFARLLAACGIIVRLGHGDCRCLVQVLHSRCY
mmetsp:Transcript_3419/g.9725  ORF Transcript_3419/g.9725 Transcript_3419/m.9725 type:complete len:240 (+) Transcript_3419:3497-4216(+)